MKIGIVGAGISGLAIALASEKAGHEVVIFESESDLGGRMSSIRFGPYIIDVGFHVLHTAYPSLHRWIDFSKLEFKEMEKNLALRVDTTDSEDKFNVFGRGVLHLSVLIETMRREGYELQVGRPQVIIKEIDGVKSEPYETLSIAVSYTHLTLPTILLV